ncbi:septation protein SepH [Nocardioides sp.]|uniref:septation protein SepH n=1 Tax=Nocardioides sp. TaxID=35761 RepID=UPI002B922DFE|nr:septation protein SepH [Nocardioides sp.]HXH80802.1 septation protein SepH [Nocardioides sp.]
MAHLTLAGRSDDGKRLLLVSDNGAEFTLDIDAPLRAALRGEHARIGQLEIQMDSSLRPRDIQNRIRAGESPDAVAQAAQTTVEKIMAFAAPVIAERAHVADRAQGSSLRRKAGDTGARTLGEAVGAHLRGLNVDPNQVEWDSWRREDGRWTLTGSFNTPQRRGTATFAFDLRGSFVTSEDADARWLVGEEVSSVSTAAKSSRDDLQQARSRRLSAVPADELPLGEDAIELAASDHDGDVEEVEASPTETTLDLTEAGLRTDQASEAPPADDDAEGADDPVVGSASGSGSSDPAADEPAARRPARKGRGRASVPSWDEIMFGGPSD